MVVVSFLLVRKIFYGILFLIFGGLLVLCGVFFWLRLEILFIVLLNFVVKLVCVFLNLLLILLKCFLKIFFGLIDELYGILVFLFRGVFKE